MIAVNYPARSYGINRHCNIAEAKKLCPDLIVQHVATWREGEDKWAYRDDAAANIASDKVSLDPYRLESRKILSLVRDFLPGGSGPTSSSHNHQQHLQRVEKASVDEVFLDLSAHVHSLMLDQFPELKLPPPYDDPAELLPRPSVAALDWQADALVDLNEEQESEDPDWDDVAMLLGSEIVRKLRAEVRQKLGYTCSAGIAGNKLLSKLGSAFKKPNKQTVVRNRAAASFIEGFKLAKIRNLGGKLGEQVTTTFGTEEVKDLLPVSLEQMKAKLGDETGLWLYNTIRGIDTSEVNPRTQIKSMLSAKSFRPSINTTEQATRWLRIFAGDIYSRLVEEGVLENKRRPRTIHLSARHAGQTRSRQGPIMPGKVLDETTLMNLAKDLLTQILAEGTIFPCYNLSLSVGGFEEGIKNNMGIGGFLVKGDEAISLRASTSHNTERSNKSPPSPEEKAPSSKRQKTKDGGGSIQRFFGRFHQQQRQPSKNNTAEEEEEEVDEHDETRTEEEEEAATRDRRVSTMSDEAACLEQSNSGEPRPYMCGRCHARFEIPETLQSHMDWHLAKDLQAEERSSATFSERPPSMGNVGARAGGNNKQGGRGNGGKLERGQRKLKFG